MFSCPSVVEESGLTYGSGGDACVQRFSLQILGSYYLFDLGGFVIHGLSLWLQGLYCGEKIFCQESKSFLPPSKLQRLFE